MTTLAPFRIVATAVMLTLLGSVPAFARFRNPQARPAPPPRSAPQRQPEQQYQPRARFNQAQPPVNEEHLQRWMESHKNQSLEQQQRALQNLPGFRELPPEVQRQRLNTLRQLYNMNPQERQRMLNGVEGLERLSPPQRQRWDGAVQQLHSTPLPRRRMMARAIIDLRQMPPGQREQVMNSPQFRSEFSDGERSTISTILMAYPNQTGPPVQ